MRQIVELGTVEDRFDSQEADGRFIVLKTTRLNSV